MEAFLTENPRRRRRKHSTHKSRRSSMARRRHRRVHRRSTASVRRHRTRSRARRHSSVRGLTKQRGEVLVINPRRKHRRHSRRHHAMSNPRRRHYRVRRNPAGLRGVKSVLIDSSKALAGFLATIGISNVTTNFISGMLSSVGATGQAVAKNAIRVGLVTLGAPVLRKTLGGKAADNVKVIVTTYALYDVLMTIIKQNSTVATIAPTFEAETLKGVGRIYEAQLSGVGRISDSAPINSVAGSMNAIQEYAQGS